MTQRKILLTSLITPALTFICIVLYFITSDKSHDVMDFLFGLMLSVAVWVIGVVPALILSNVFKNPKYEPGFYLGTQLVIIAAFALFLVIARSSTNKEISNHEHNVDFIKPRSSMEISSGQQSMMIALRELGSNFPDSNSFRLTSYSRSTTDTVLKGKPQSYHKIDFTYQLESSQPVMLARIIVTGQSGKTEYFNIKAGKNKEYLARKTRINNLIDSTQKVITNMTDSLSRLSQQKP